MCMELNECKKECYVMIKNCCNVNANILGTLFLRVSSNDIITCYAICTNLVGIIILKLNDQIITSDAFLMVEIMTLLEMWRMWYLHTSPSLQQITAFLIVYCNGNLIKENFFLSISSIKRKALLCTRFYFYFILIFDLYPWSLIFIFLLSLVI